MIQLVSPSVECDPVPGPSALGASVVPKGPGWQGPYIPACMCVPVCALSCINAKF